MYFANQHLPVRHENDLCTRLCDSAICRQHVVFDPRFANNTLTGGYGAIRSVYGRKRRTFQKLAILRVFSSTVRIRISGIFFDFRRLTRHLECSAPPASPKKNFDPASSVLRVSPP